MKFTVYRANDGFVVSPDCMQAPIAVQHDHVAACACGPFDLPANSVPHLADTIAREGFAVVRPGDLGYDALNRLCLARQAARSSAGV